MGPIPDHARCWTCNYALRGLSTPRCPECGRAFDPDHLKTMNLGRTPGIIGRFLLRPSGWLPVVLLLTAAGLVLSATRWPPGGPNGGAVLTSLDLMYYFNSIHLRPKLLSYTDWAYALGLLIAAPVTALWLIKLPVREIARRIYRQPAPPPVNMGRRIMLGTIAILAMGGSIAIGWPYRIARAWVRQMMAAAPGSWENPPPPITLSAEQYLPVLRAAAIQMPSSTERLHGLKLLVEDRLSDASSILAEAIPRETDPHLRATELLLLAMFRNQQSIDAILARWDDPDPQVRAAAADSIALLSASIDGKRGWAELPVCEINTTPPIYLGEFADSNGEGFVSEIPSMVRYPFIRGQAVETLNAKLHERMVLGHTAMEREAAARALIVLQNDYRLRVAEWGVWIASGENLVLIKAILEEIPPFVHRIGDSVASLSDRLLIPMLMNVDKPVLHLTVDRPMAVKIQVRIEEGRPLFAYPEPDDFELAAAQFEPLPDSEGNQKYGGKYPEPIPAQFDLKDAPSLKDAHTGFPWLDPAHDKISAPGARLDLETQITSLGLLWQSVILSPAQLEWMAPPLVPADSRFNWWKRLREVPCAWVCNRGESERFLYYDGATAAHSPVTVRHDGGVLQTLENPNGLTTRQQNASFEPISAGNPSRVLRHGFFISVDSTSKQPNGCVTAVPGTTDLSKEPMLTGDALINRFRSLLTDAGLTDAEAAGLVDCWRTQFFQTPGSRFILLMSASDYDRLCPIRIDPPPTELVRVGLVLTEFGEKGL